MFDGALQIESLEEDRLEGRPAVAMLATGPVACSVTAFRDGEAEIYGLPDLPAGRALILAEPGFGLVAVTVTGGGSGCLRVRAGVAETERKAVLARVALFLEDVR